MWLLLLLEALLLYECPDAARETRQLIILRMNIGFAEPGVSQTRHGQVMENLTGGECTAWYML